MTFVSTMVLGPSPIYPIMKELDVKQAMYLKEKPLLPINPILLAT